MKAKPFIKWAGGKRKLVPELVKRMPSSYGTYFEPFLGGGALFFELEPRKAILSDLNSDLTRTYWVVDHSVEDLIFKLDILEAAHRKGGLEHYLKVRAQNSAKLAQVDCAARLIYLNKTCFNGLYRVNKSGQFNVPMGKFKSPPLICDADNLRECSKVLSGIEVNYSDYRGSLHKAKRNDFVYLDPPYIPLSTSADFTSYTKKGFGPKDQKELAALARTLKLRGVHVLLSNAGNQLIEELYPKPFFDIEKVAMRRNINSVASKRGDVVEYLIS